MKRLVKISLVVGVVLIVFIGNSLAGIYSGGSGTEGDPYQIGTAEDIIEMSGIPDDWNDYFIMISDVDMSGYTFTTAVIAADTDNTNSGFDGTKFTGILEGAYHVVHNLTIDTLGAQNDHLGLFGAIRYYGEVKNLGLKNVSIIGGDDSICLGGLCGLNDRGTISNCFSISSVSGGDFAWYLGGLCGASTGLINNCYATGSVMGEEHANYLGGLCGEHYDGTINNCYSTGSVTGYSYLGGLCGDNYWGKISNCYSTGPVSGGYFSHDLGGLCGNNYQGTISNCFWDIDTSGQNTSEGGTGLSTEDMQQIATFTGAGWDFVNIWDICDGTNYPRFIWQIPAADFTCPDGVDLIDFSLLSGDWQTGGLEAYEKPDLTGDGVINIDDVIIFVEQWLGG